MKIDGNKISKEIVAELKSQPKPESTLVAVIFGGEDNDSFGFLKKKQELAKKLGVDFNIKNLSPDLSRKEARIKIKKLAESDSCGGLIIQLPLPDHLRGEHLADVIPKEKDIDVMGESAVGAFYNGMNPVVPPAVATIKEILSRTNFSLESKKVAVVGPGFLVGKPAIVWLIGKVGEIYAFDKGSDLKNLNRVDLVISGVGKPGLVSSDYLKDGAGVIDFGYGRENGEISGDFDLSDVGNVSFYTPTPGGTGPILVTKLIDNFYTLNS